MSAASALPPFTREVLRRRGVLSDLDWHHAAALARIGREADERVLLAAALASRQVGVGHVCLDLAALVAAGAPVDEAGEPLREHAWPSLDGWLAALQASPLVGPPDPAAATPLVLDARGRLYLRRYWQHERRIVEAVRERVGVRVAVDDALLDAGLSRLFPDAGGAQDGQRRAALAALTRRFCVISGGPGTGKTYTVVRIIALLIEQALHAGAPPPRMLLMAPTGKAAARLVESIRRDAAGLACDAAVRAAIPDDAATIHRALGTVAGRLAEFRHGRERPLIADVVLVDEASMVDVALMARLLDAVPAPARVILLGDQDQLASVEAGAVLGDICNSGGAPRAASPSGGGMGHSIAELTHSYRYGPESGIGRLARAINAGDAELALRVLADGGDVRLRPPIGETLAEALEAQIDDGLAPYLAAAPGTEQLRALERFRVLCAHRVGPAGAETVNKQIEQYLERRGLVRAGEVLYPGRPIIVNENDYQLGLFNGDVGVIVRDPGESTLRLACFPRSEGEPRLISPARLPRHATVFAMTVHKSQGSEFDEVAVLLPEKASPVVTRELLYTAVTRARARVTIYAGEDVVRHAVRQRVQRASGLREALWGGG